MGGYTSKQVQQWENTFAMKNTVLPIMEMTENSKNKRAGDISVQK